MDFAIYVIYCNIASLIPLWWRRDDAGVGL